MQHIRTLAVLVLVLFIGVPAASVAYADAGTTQTVTNETIVVENDSYTSVDAGSPPYLDNETVHYNGSTVDESNYDWATGNGSLKATGGTLAAESPANATITYSYTEAGPWTRGATDVLYVFFAVFGILLVWVGGSFTTGAMGGLRNGGGR